MKNLLLFFCLVTLFAFGLSSCATSDESELMELTEISQDEMQDRTLQLLPPDLKVSLVTSNLPLGCTDSPLSGNAVCFGPGSTDIIITAKIENDSPTNITSQFEVEFCIVGIGCTSFTVPGLNANSSTTEDYQFSVPCASGTPPFQLVQEQIVVTADATNVINETNEGNNSRRYFICRAI